MSHVLSDHRRLSRLGKIKMGVLVQPAQGKPYPRATDFFVLPDAVQKIHGEKPRQLPIMLPSDDPEEVFPQELKSYRAAGLYCAGDNKTAKRWQEGKLVERPCPCELLESGECSPTATLNVMLYKAPGIGVYQLTIRQEAAIVEINTALEKFTAMFGGLRGIPFVLRLEQVQRQRYDEKSKAMVKVMVWTPKIDTEMTLEEIFTSRKALGATVDRLMLPAMGELEEDDHPAPETPPSPQEAAETVAVTPIPAPAPIAPPAPALAPQGPLFETPQVRDAAEVLASALLVARDSPAIGLSTTMFNAYAAHKCGDPPEADKAAILLADVEDAATSPAKGGAFKAVATAMAKKYLQAHPTEGGR